MLKKTKKLFVAVMCSLMVAATLMPGLSTQMGFATTVEAAAKKVKINKKKLSIVEGQKKTLKVTGTSKKITWSSSNKRVAVVSGKGIVTARKAGTATITAKAGGKKIGSCKVTVKRNQYICGNQNPNTWTYYDTSVTFNPLKAYYENGNFVLEGFWHNPTNITFTRMYTEITVKANSINGKVIANSTFVTDAVIPGLGYWVKDRLVFNGSQIKQKNYNLTSLKGMVVVTRLL